MTVLFGGYNSQAQSSNRIHHLSTLATMDVNFPTPESRCAEETNTWYILVVILYVYIYIHNILYIHINHSLLYIYINTYIIIHIHIPIIPIICPQYAHYIPCWDKPQPLVISLESRSGTAGTGVAGGLTAGTVATTCTTTCTARSRSQLSTRTGLTSEKIETWNHCFDMWKNRERWEFPVYFQYKNGKTTWNNLKLVTLVVTSPFWWEHGLTARFLPCLKCPARSLPAS